MLYITTDSSFSRGVLLATGLFLTACTGAAQAAEYTMMRDPDCGCCEEWAKHAGAGLEADVSVEDHADMATVKDRLGVPAALRSCHSMVVEGYVIEGHVPADAVAKLLRERPDGVNGLAVPGMPLGSPGMEVGGQAQPFDVIAFGDGGEAVFASYN